MAGTFLAVREVETNDVKPALEQRFGHPEHAAVAHMAAGAVRENKKPAAGRGQRGLEDRGGFFFADSDPPRRLSAPDEWSRADPFSSGPWSCRRPGGRILRRTGLRGRRATPSHRSSG